MKIGFIGDIIGRPGRQMVQYHLKKIKDDQKLDIVIANYENASHGFGLSEKNAKELFSYGIDIMTGGNHTWDKKDIFPLLENYPILRPINYPLDVPGKGMEIVEINGERLGVINLMGYYSMPMVENPFVYIRNVVNELHILGVKNIFIDMHAEATSEKRALLMMLKDKVSAICGTHTHVGTDDLQIFYGVGYVTDVGLTGCMDNVIGMEESIPIKRFLTGLPGRFDVPNRCKKIFQIVVLELDKGRCKDAYKIKAYDEDSYFISQKAYVLG